MKKNQLDNDVLVNEIHLRKRTLENNTHEVNEDKKIKRITSWRKSQNKFLKNLKYNILSFGLLHLFSLIFPKLYINLYCNPSSVKESDFFLVENIYDQAELCLINHLKASNNKIKYNFEYKHMRYEYDEKNDVIIPVYLNLSDMNNDNIINKFYEGLYTKDMVENAKLKYNKNEFNLNIKLYLYLFVNNQIPTYIIIALIEFLEFLFLKNYLNLIFKLITEIIFVLVQMIHLKLNIINIYKKEFTLDVSGKKLKVKRKYLSKEENQLFNFINITDLLPGDIIFLYNNDYVPCDGIIIEGECLVNDIELSGKLNTYKRKALEYNHKKFDYRDNIINIIYHGMKILQIYSKTNQKYIMVLCINTGINTMKANQYTNILNLLTRKKEYKTSYSFLGERKIIYFNMLLSIFATIASGFIIYGSYLKIYEKQNVQKNIPNYIITIFCKSLMTSFFIVKDILIFITSFNLNKLNITCFDQSKLFDTGKINTILLNKSKTLSESDLTLNSYIPVYISSGKKDKINLEYFTEEKSKDINTLLLEYYKNYLNNNFIESQERLILFFECLLSCSNVEKYNLEFFGSDINIKLFKDLKWDIKQYDEINNKIYLNNKYYTIKTIMDIFSNNYYKLSKLRRDNNNKRKNDNSNYISIISPLYNLNDTLIKTLFSNMDSNSYKIRIYKRFIYRESLDSAAIVHNLLTNEIRFMVKGTPEEVINKCNKFTLPNNIEQIISSYRKKGFIILICASKLLNIFEYNDVNNLEFYMDDLIFCGLLILENRTKPGIINSLKEVKKYNDNILIISGDNEYNCLSTFVNCGLIENKNVFVLDNEKNNNITIKKILSLNNKENFKINEPYKNSEIGSIFNRIEQKNKEKKKSNFSLIKENSRESIIKRYSYYDDYNIHQKSKNPKRDNAANKVNNDSYFEIGNSQNTINKQLNFMEKYYFKRIFTDYEDIKKGIFCLNGNLFNYLYTNKSKKGVENFLKKIMKKTKILFNMSSIDKSLLVDYFRDDPNNTVCTIGQLANDMDSIISSDIGINLKKPNNLNTLLCHFYSSTKDLLCLKTIIQYGRFLFENIIILESISFVYSIIINLYVFASMARDSPINQTQFDFLEIEFLLMLVASLLSKPDNENISKINNPKLLNIYYVILSFIILLIKPADIKLFNFFHEGDHTLSIPFRNKEYLSFYFILCVVGIISTIFALNFASFYKRNPFENYILIFVSLVYFTYIIILLCLESSNISYDVLNITTFAFNEKLIDSFTDNNKIRAIIVVIFDLGSTIFVTIIMKIIFRKLMK